MIKVTVANSDGTFLTWEFATEYEAGRAVFSIAQARGQFIAFKVQTVGAAD